MKETWNLREAIRKTIVEAMDSNNYSDTSTPLEMEERLVNEIEKNYRCPYVRGSDEGTQWCGLAEDAVKKMDEEFKSLVVNLHRDHLYVVEELDKKLEAAQRVVEAAKCTRKSYDNDPEGAFFMAFENMIADLDSYDAQMKDDFLGEKSDNTPQL